MIYNPSLFIKAENLEVPYILYLFIQEFNEIFQRKLFHVEY